MTTRAKFIGSLFILMGTAIGAGMLALPLISAHLGFVHAAWLLVAIWATMTASALLVLEVNLAFLPYKNSFSTMASETLGPAGKIISWVTCLVLLYALTSAYIAGNTSLLDELTKNLFKITIPSWLNAVIFTVVFGGAVYWSTQAVDILNRLLMSFKGIMLVIMLALLMPHVNFVRLLAYQPDSHYLWFAAPIFLTSFGFHTVIPSLSNYLDRDAKALRNIILIGATVPLLIYILWLICALGIVPVFGPHSFTQLEIAHGSVGQFVTSLDDILHNRWISIGTRKVY